MAQQKIIPKPLFDTLENLAEAQASWVVSHIDSLNIKTAAQELHLSREFLLSYMGSADTFTAYRREVERFLQWSWLIAKKSLPDINRNDLRDYLEFVNQPPKDWITDKTVARFQDKLGERVPNPAWRPFVVKISKLQRNQGQTPNVLDYRLGNKSMQAVISGLSTYFTYLQQEDFIETNPVALIRQKSRYIQRHQQQKVTRKLSHLQWQHVISAAELMANEDTDDERIYFMMSAFYLLGLRISELAETPGRIPAMGDFAPDKHSRWWFTTVGKGNKVRDIAVPDIMLNTLKRYRTYLGLTPLPSRNEQTPLLNKQRGRGGLGTRQIRNLVQRCFNRAVTHLTQQGLEDAAQDLSVATVHWLRHTAISADIEQRPREHVRDDAGHENAATTDQYIDTDRVARHESAKHKQLKPKYDEIENEQ